MQFWIFNLQRNCAIISISNGIPTRYSFIQARSEKYVMGSCFTGLGAEPQLSMILQFFGSTVISKFYTYVGKNLCF